MNVYPEIFNRIINRIDSDWEPTLNLIEKLIEDGRIRNISIPIFRLMTEASIKAFISNPLLIASNISYEQALDDMVDILISGIENKE